MGRRPNSIHDAGRPDWCVIGGTILGRADVDSVLHEVQKAFDD